MTDYDPSRPIPIESKRVPLEREVALQFQNFSGFIHQYSHNISMGGIFIKSVDPRPAGSLCRLEFRLADGYKLIEGRGEVIWVRDRDESPERPAGMGIRFLELEPESQRLIRRMVEEHERKGGKPFDVDRVPRGAEEAPPASPPPPASTSGPPGDGAAEPAAPEAGTPEAGASEVGTPEAGGTGGAAKAPALATGKFQLPDLDEKTSTPGGLGPPLLEPSPGPVVAGPAPAAVSGGTASVGRRRGRRAVLVGLVLAAVAGAGAYVWVERPELLGLGGTDLARTPAAGPEPPAVADGSTPARGRPAAPPSGAAESLPAEDDAAPAGEGEAATGGVGSRGAGPAGAAREPEGPAEETAAETAPEEPPLGPAVPPAAAGTGTGAVATEPPAAAGPSSGLGVLERVTWRREDAWLVVELTTAGEVTPASFVSTRLEGTAESRHLVRLLGIGEPFRSSALNVGEPELRRIRTGHHPGSGGGELHVVLDLARPRVEVARAETAGRTLRLYLAAAPGG